MKYHKLFSTIPFPFRIKKVNSSTIEVEGNGSLFNTPDYAKKNDGFWEKINYEGWSTCQSGFAVLVKKIPGNYFLILHGLKVKPFWKQQGKTSGLSIVLTQLEVNNYVDNFIGNFTEHLAQINKENKNQVRAMAAESVHEIRSMNTNLYHIAYELEKEIQYNSSRCISLTKNIVALSELISARIELTDLTNSDLSNYYLDKKPSQVYGKFLKIIKCYIAYALKREISIKISGESHSQTKGLQNFTMIPLIIIDNAVKYSPNNNTINVAFAEDEININVNIQSSGPKIEIEEINSIFERGVRGSYAISSGQSGSGIGLYFAKYLLELIDATISVDQDHQISTSVNGKKYYPTTFSLSFKKFNTH